MESTQKLIYQSRKIQDLNFPLQITDEEALALLPYWLHRQPETKSEDSEIYDQLRAAELPHSLKQTNWTFAQLQKAQIDYPKWSSFLDDAYHARRPCKQTRRIDFAPVGMHNGRYATHRGVDLDLADCMVIAMHGRGAAADRLTRDLEFFTDGQQNLALLAPQATDNAWYPNPASDPPEDNQPYVNDTLAVLDSLWEIATSYIESKKIILCGFSQGACAVLTWVRTRDFVPGAVLGFSGFQIEVGGSYQGLTETYLYCSRSQGDEFCIDQNIGKTISDLKTQAPHSVIHTDPGNLHVISEYDGQCLRHAIQLVKKN